MNKKQQIVALSLTIFATLFLSIGANFFVKLNACEDKINFLYSLSDKQNLHIQFYEVYKLMGLKKEKKERYLDNQKTSLAFIDKQYQIMLSSFSKECSWGVHKKALLKLLHGQKQHYLLKQIHFKEDQDMSWIDSLIDKIALSMNKRSFR